MGMVNNIIVYITKMMGYFTSGFGNFTGECNPSLSWFIGCLIWITNRQKVFRNIKEWLGTDSNKNLILEYNYRIQQRWYMFIALSNYLFNRVQQKRCVYFYLFALFRKSFTDNPNSLIQTPILMMSCLLQTNSLVTEGKTKVLVKAFWIAIQMSEPD